MIVYLAAPLFSQSQRAWNRALAQALEKKLRGLEVILPQDFKVSAAYNKKQHFGQIFSFCVDAVARANAVVAVLDGADADSGACFEAGLAYAKGIPVVGVRTDFRENQERGVNLMLSRACARMIAVPAFNEDVSTLATQVAAALRSLA